MKNFFLILLIVLLAGSGYFLYNLNNTNIQFKRQISSLEGELSGLTLQIVELQSIQTITGTTEEVLPELSNTNTGDMSLEEENQALKELAQKHKDALILEKLKNKSTTDITVPTNNKINYLQNPRNCNRLEGGEAIYGTPNTNYFKSVKFINSKLQEIWDNGQHLVSQYINEANNNLSNASLSNSDKCAYSWLIDELQNQKGYLKTYKTQNGITTIGIDFVTYIDNVSQIDYGPTSGPLFQTKNTSTKVREYKLASNPQLKTLNTNSNGYVINAEKYLSDFNEWLNEFCNNESIYNGERDIDRKGNDLGEIDWNNFRGEAKNIYCVKNRLSPSSNYGEAINSFGFNLKGEIQKINLNRWYLSLAG